MEKITISFFKERYDLREDHVFMRIDGLDEKGLELFKLKPEEREAALVRVMKEQGVIIQIDRTVAENNGCSDRFPPRESHPPLEKKAERSKSRSDEIGMICERTYRLISERMGEFLKEGLATEAELRSSFPIPFKNIEVIEQVIDEEVRMGKDVESVKKLCDDMLMQYNKVFESFRHMVKRLQNTRKDIFDKVSTFVENKKTAAPKKLDFDDDFFNQDSSPIQTQAKQDDDDVLGLMG